MIKLTTYISEALKGTNIFKESILIFLICGIIALILICIKYKFRNNCK